ncbi:Crp/Fnr family transcriptional regulator [Olivibacter sp. SA151]|uniref:Crp/Fnr family transcriptional regulator n=1 Tax=Olivibacter jilunii TaxID=985016 RepID=UPI003F164CE6
MVYDVVLKNINKHISLDTDEISYFTSLLKEKKVSKRAMILKEGQVCKEISFVKSGALRAYYRDKAGKESTIMFAITDWWVTDMFCFVNEQPAMLNIEAIEDSVVLQILKADLDKLYIKIPKFERFFRIIMQNAYIREQLRVIQNLSLPANERYNLFLSKYPEIVKQVKQKQIASYLGITPEFLSMLRRNKRTKRIS